MKGLLRKDLYVLVKYIRSYLLLIVFFWALYIFGNHGFFYFGYPIIMISMMGLTLTSLDEHSHWDQYCASLPVTRAQMVSGKYTLLGLLMLTVTILSGLVSLLFSHRIGTSFQSTVYLAAFMLGIGLVMPSVSLPLVFKFGTEKARWVSLLTTALCIVLFFILSSLFFENLFDDITYQSYLPLEFMLLALPAGLLLYAVSWILSVKIYQKREL